MHMEQFHVLTGDNSNIGIALFNQMEHGYLMNPKLVSRIAEIENIVGIKNITSLDELRETRILCGDKMAVAADEEQWLLNYLSHGSEVMIPSPLPYVLQSKKLRLVKEYITLAKNGEIAKAWEAYKRMEPIRRRMLMNHKP